MTGKTEADSIGSLIEELKNAVRIESCDKEDDDIADLDVHFNTYNNIDDKTPTAELQDDSKIGYVLLDTTIPPNPISSSVTFSETQSISSFCDSHLCPSCESAGYESESSESVSKHRVTLSTRINSLPQTLPPHGHQNDNFHTASHNTHISSNHSNHNDAGSSDQDYRPPFTAVRVRDRDTASESTSGISSQSHELKTCFTSMTSDSETQTDVDPNIKDDQSESSGTTGTGPEQRNDQKFYLDRYTHLTKRRRDKGIPNVAKWFGMSAVEHLIQHSIDCNKWMWNEEPNTPENELKVGHRVPDRLDLKKTRSKSEPVHLNQLKCQDRQDSRFLQVMSDAGPCHGNKDSLSSTESSPRPSIHSLDDFNNRKKKSNGWAQRISNSRTTCTEKIPKIRKSCLKKLTKENGVKSSKESLEDRKKNATLAEMLNEDLGEDTATAEAAEKKKKKAQSTGRGRRAGGTMMKCALFDEFVDLSGGQPEQEVPSGRRSKEEEGGSKTRLARGIQGSNVNKSVPR